MTQSCGVAQRVRLAKVEAGRGHLCCRNGHRTLIPNVAPSTVSPCSLQWPTFSPTAVTEGLEGLQPLLGALSLAAFMSPFSAPVHLGRAQGVGHEAFSRPVLPSSNQH